MFYSINTIKKHKTLLYQVCTYDAKKVPILTWPPSQSIICSCAPDESNQYNIYTENDLDPKKMMSVMKICMFYIEIIATTMVSITKMLLIHPCLSKIVKH